jgi:outer membrane receptor protein involved in Fe transport
LFFRKLQQSLTTLFGQPWGRAETYVDFTAGYRGRLKGFGGAQYRVQLNVRNLLNENDPIPVGALTTGMVSRLATIDSRVIVTTFGVDF